MEKLQEHAKDLLVANLDAMLDQVDQEMNTATGATTTTEKIPGSQIYPHDLTNRPAFPSCSIMARRGTPHDQQFDFEEWEYTLEIEVYQAGQEPGDLLRQIERYAEATKRIMRNPENWDGVAHDPRVTGIFYSNVLPDESGLIRACRVNVAVSVIENF